MKKILSMALSFALAANTFAMQTYAEGFETVGNASAPYADTYQAMPENQISHYRIDPGGFHTGWTEKSLSGYAGITKKVTRTSDLGKDNTGWQLSPFYLSPISGSEDAMTEYWQVNGNYVLSVNVKDDSPAGIEAGKFNMYFGYYSFRNYTDTYPDANHSLQLTKEWQNFAGSFTIPDDPKAKTKKFVAGLVIGNGIPKDQSFIASDFYIAKEVAYDIEFSGQTELEPGKSADFSAKVVNQVGTNYTKASKSFEWFVTDSERMATVDGFTVTPNAGDSSKVTISYDKKKVAPAEYALVVKSDNIVKGFKIIVPKEVLYNNGTITLEIKAGDVKPSYDVFSEFTVTAGNIEANDIDWFAVRENRMDEEDKIIFTPDGVNAKVSFANDIESGTYYLVAQSKKDDTKRHNVCDGKPHSYKFGKLDLGYANVVYCEIDGEVIFEYPDVSGTEIIVDCGTTMQPYGVGIRMTMSPSADVPKDAESFEKLKERLSKATAPALQKEYDVDFTNARIINPESDRVLTEKGLYKSDLMPYAVSTTEVYTSVDMAEKILGQKGIVSGGTYTISVDGKTANLPVSTKDGINTISLEKLCEQLGKVYIYDVTYSGNIVVADEGGQNPQNMGTRQKKVMGLLKAAMNYEEFEF